MDQKKVLSYLAYAILGVYIFGNLLFIIKAETIVHAAQESDVPHYSIFSSKSFFIAYNVWGILLSLTTGWAIFSRNKIVFLFSVMLLLIVMFYPWFTSQPDPSKGKNNPTDSLKVTEQHIPEFLIS